MRRLWDRFGPHDPRYLTITLDAAEVVLRSGDRDRATDMFRHVVDTGREISGPDHPEALRAARALAQDYLRTHAHDHPLRRDRAEKVRRLLAEL